MENEDPLLSIGELASRAGLPVRTIRFWSDVGVVPPAARTEGGRRLCNRACVAQLELVATLRELGPWPDRRAPGASGPGKHCSGRSQPPGRD